MRHREPGARVLADQGAVKDNMGQLGARRTAAAIISSASAVSGKGMRGAAVERFEHEGDFGGFGEVCHAARMPANVTLVSLEQDDIERIRRPVLDTGLGCLSSTPRQTNSQTPCQARGDGIDITVRSSVSKCQRQDRPPSRHGTGRPLVAFQGRSPDRP